MDEVESFPLFLSVHWLQMNQGRSLYPDGATMQDLPGDADTAWPEEAKKHHIIIEIVHKA